MRKFLGMVNQPYIFMIALIVVSLACNAPDVADAVDEAVAEDCTDIGREKYEKYAAQLGQTPETPKYPGGAVYEVCFINHELHSVRMSDGYEPGESNKLPDGIYFGETNLHMMLESDIDDSYLKPACKENTIMVIIGTDGSVKGEILSFCYSNKDTKNEEMKTTYHADVTGVIGVLGNDEQLSIAYTSHTYFTSPQWETSSLDKTIDFEYPYHIQVFDDVMTLTPAANVNDYYSFILQKD